MNRKDRSHKVERLVVFHGKTYLYLRFSDDFAYLKGHLGSYAKECDID